MPSSTPNTRSSPRTRSRRSWWTTNGWRTLAAAVQGELDRVSQTLTERIRQLAERYAAPLPQLTDEVATLAGPCGRTPQKDGSDMEVKPGIQADRGGRHPGGLGLCRSVEACECHASKERLPRTQRENPRNTQLTLTATSSE